MPTAAALTPSPATTTTMRAAKVTTPLAEECRWATTHFNKTQIAMQVDHPCNHLVMPPISKTIPIVVVVVSIIAAVIVIMQTPFKIYKTTVILTSRDLLLMLEPPIHFKHQIATLWITLPPTTIIWGLVEAYKDRIHLCQEVAKAVTTVPLTAVEEMGVVLSKIVKATITILVNLVLILAGEILHKIKMVQMTVMICLHREVVVKYLKPREIYERLFIADCIYNSPTISISKWLTTTTTILHTQSLLYKLLWWDR